LEVGETVSDTPREAVVPGLTNPRTLAVERFLIRMRGGSATQSAWRLSAASEEGQGAIILVEVSPEEKFYRAEGVFLGWPQERMEAAYRALLPKPEEDGFELHQLG
jgi:hypothetical protein